MVMSRMIGLHRETCAIGSHEVVFSWRSLRCLRNRGLTSYKGPRMGGLIRKCLRELIKLDDAGKVVDNVGLMFDRDQRLRVDH